MAEPKQIQDLHIAELQPRDIDDASYTVRNFIEQTWNDILEQQQKLKAEQIKLTALIQAYELYNLQLNYLRDAWIQKRPPTSSKKRRSKELPPASRSTSQP